MVVNRISVGAFSRSLWLWARAVAGTERGGLWARNRRCEERAIRFAPVRNAGAAGEVTLKSSSLRCDAFENESVVVSPYEARLMVCGMIYIF